MQCQSLSDRIASIGQNLRAIKPSHPAIKNRRGWRFNPRERLARKQAIRFYTINNAGMTFEEEHKGSLKSGRMPTSS